MTNVVEAANGGHKLSKNQRRRQKKKDQKQHANDPAENSDVENFAEVIVHVENIRWHRLAD